MKKISRKKEQQKNPLWIIPLMLVCSLLTAGAHISWKFGTNRISSGLDFFTILFLLVGFLFYALAAISLITSLKYGELSFTYPLIALSYVWVSLAAFFLLNENLKLFNWIGISSIFIGVSFIGLGSRK